MSKLKILAPFLLVYFLIGAQGITSGQRISKEARPFTTQLPVVDKIEIQRVSGGERIEKVENTKIISGADARIFASMWRTQQYNDKYSASCHEPAYAIKFYAKEKLITYVSICWNCRNMYSLLDENKFGVGFNARSAKGKALLQFFQKRLG